MALSINTQSAKYQQYLTGLANLRADILPRFKAFSKLSEEKQLWWLQRDPLMRKLIKMALVINKHIITQSLVEAVQND